MTDDKLRLPAALQDSKFITKQGTFPILYSYKNLKDWSYIMQFFFDDLKQIVAMQSLVEEITVPHLLEWMSVQHQKQY